MKHEYVGTTPTTLANGQPVEFGDVVDLNKTQARANSHLIDAGVLVPVSTEPDAKSGDSNAPDNSGREGDQ